MLSYRKLRLLNSSGQSSNSSDDELYSKTRGVARYNRRV